MLETTNYLTMANSGHWDQEDWSMQLAATGATEREVWDINYGQTEAEREEVQSILEKRKDNLQAAAGSRAKADDVEKLKAKNKAALAALRAKRADALPEGWKTVQSRSRPGEVVYENVYTEERQAWYPTEAARKPAELAENQEVSASAKKGISAATKERNKRALAARKAKADALLPEGWRKVESASKPGEYVYENMNTEERVAWYPTEPAAKKAMPEQTLDNQGKPENLAKVLYEYTAASAEEMDLHAGDIVRVEHKTDNGWWVGTNKTSGRLGMFPESFVMELE